MYRRAGSGLYLPENAIEKPRLCSLMPGLLGFGAGGGLYLPENAIEKPRLCSLMPGLLGFGAGGGGAPLTVEATNTSSEEGSTTQTVSLPAALAAGDLLIIDLVLSSGPTVTTPSGWTELFKVISSGQITIASYWKNSDGGEGGSVAVTVGRSVEGGHTSYRISGWQGTPEAATNASDADPPNLTPSWGSAENLWIALCGWHTETTDITAPPSNYSNLLTANSSGDRSNIGTAERILAASSENPGTFTGAANEYPRSATIAVQPA